MLSDHGPAFAETVLRVLRTPYPYAAQHVSTGPADVGAPPHVLHPAFHGSFDWHSSVHVQWSAVRLLEAGVAGEVAEELVAELDGRLAPGPCAVETAYLRAHPSFERPYGWAWVVLLAAACASSAHPAAGRWAAATEPLADAVADLVLDWLPRLSRPVRHGVHSSTAFALTLLDRGCTVLGRDDVVAAVRERALHWFAADVGHAATFEPSGEDFLSPTLTEADLLRRVLPRDRVGPWLAAFAPDLGAEGDHLLEPPVVLDPTDGRMGHLVGLALSRAWQLRGLAPHLGDREERVLAAADAQVAWALPAVTGDDFMATHWLVSFVLLGELAV
ncbi:DUF2891 domain-containing protein [Angustibacter speluncae]